MNPRISNIKNSKKAKIAGQSVNKILRLYIPILAVLLIGLVGSIYLNFSKALSADTLINNEAPLCTKYYAGGVKMEQSNKINKRCDVTRWCPNLGAPYRGQPRARRPRRTAARASTQSPDGQRCPRPHAPTSTVPAGDGSRTDN